MGCCRTRRSAEKGAAVDEVRPRILLLGDVVENEVVVAVKEEGDAVVGRRGGAPCCNGEDGDAKLLRVVGWGVVLGDLRAEVLIF